MQRKQRGSNSVLCKGENDMLKKILNTVDKGLTLFEEWSIFLMVMTGLLALFTNVVLRYVFNYTLA
jgi:C4-dicarboxylate transporter, DctQ subunit